MIDNLTEAIAHAKEVAKDRNETANNTPTVYGDYINSCRECAAEHKQLAIWLTQLKAVKNIVREFNDDTLGFTYSSSDFITAIIEAVSEEENEDK